LLRAGEAEGVKVGTSSILLFNTVGTKDGALLGFSDGTPGDAEGANVGTFSIDSSNTDGVLLGYLLGSSEGTSLSHEVRAQAVGADMLGAPVGDVDNDSWYTSFRVS
jgi:hypothetical protein